MRKPLASLFALCATTILLVADSAGPMCSEYESFAGGFSFETSCGAGGSGDLDVRVELDHYGGSSSAERKVNSETVSVENVFADYDLSECSHDEVAGVGRIVAVDFELWVDAADTGEATVGYHCLGLDVHQQGSQQLPCVPMLEGKDKCTVVMAALRG